MSRRFFVDYPLESSLIRLCGPEAHHLIHVFRASVGEQVDLFDGSGKEFPAEITRIGRSDVELAIIEAREINRELSFNLTLGVALPKGDRQRWLVEKAVELGVTRLIPLQTQRSVAKTKHTAKERLGRFVIEASKQCGRNRLMEIADSQTMSDFLRAAPPESLKLIGHPTGDSLNDARFFGPRNAESGPSDVFLAIGPEGGWTEAEVREAKECGWQVVRFGPRILRVETAALALCAAIALSGEA